MPAHLAPRERILTTATRLFYAHGVRATGIDEIIAEASVAKATLYYHFPSKTKLIEAYLARRHEVWIEEFAERLARCRTRGLSALVDALADWYQSGSFHGCAFINITAESGSGEWRAPCCAHKEALLIVIEKEIGNAAAPESRRNLAARALVGVEGLIVRLQMTRDIRVLEDGRAILRLMEKEWLVSGKRKTPLRGTASIKTEATLVRPRSR